MQCCSNNLSIQGSADDETRSEITLQIKIDNVSKYKSRVFESPKLFARYLCWSASIDASNNPDQPEIRIYLRCDSENNHNQWSCAANLEFKLLSPRQDVETLSRTLTYNFTEKHKLSRPYYRFVTWDYVLDENNGYIVDDTMTVEVNIIADPPLGIFCYKWCSRKYLGFVGLGKQECEHSNTTYLNSLVQILYFTTKFRKAINKIQTSKDDISKSIPLALQRIFHDLSYSAEAVGTKKLLKSIKWAQMSIFKPYNAHEFLRLFLEHIETRTNGTDIDGVIRNLFRGKMILYITCRDVDCSSTKTEAFYSLQLNIKGKNNINESFEHYVKGLTDIESDKYLTKELGVRDADKQVVFLDLPSVLHLNLQRFDYDTDTKRYIKCNDKFEFYEEISLDCYLQEPNPQNPANYTLQAVLVHAGNNLDGTHAVFINPKCENVWYKFVDGNVYRCSKEQAIEDNYGGEKTEGVDWYTTAYMLVYVRNSQIFEVLEEGNDSNNTLREGRKDKVLKKYETLKKQCEELITTNVKLEKNKKLMMEEIEAKDLELTILKQRISDLKELRIDDI